MDSGIVVGGERNDSGSWDSVKYGTSFSACINSFSHELRKS